MNRPEKWPQQTLAKDRRTAWLLVIGQFTLLAVIVPLPGRASWTLPADLDVAGRAAEVVGILIMVVAASGLGRGLTATPLPNEQAQLRTGGLYGYVRHPIYSGLLLFAIARTLTHGSGWVAATCVLLVVLINVKARWEERHLTRRFPDYLSYANRTPRFIPRTNRHQLSREKQIADLWRERFSCIWSRRIETRWDAKRMSPPLPTDWVFGEDLAQLSEADRAQVFAWLRACGVNPDRTRAIRLETADPSRAAIVVAEEYIQWPITVGRRGIEMRTETYITVGDVPRPLTEQLTTRPDPRLFGPT